MNQQGVQIQITNNAYGHNESIPKKSLTINQELQRTNDRDHPEYENRTITQDAHDASNYVDLEESTPESDHSSNNQLSRSHPSQFEKEAHPKQPARSDVEQHILSDETHKSLERRRKAVDVLLKPIKSSFSIRNGQRTEDDEFKTSDSPRGFLRVMCLNPKFGLRTQLLLSFGSVSAFIIAFVLIISMIIAWKSGENLKAINEASFEDLVYDIEGNSARYLPQSLTRTLIPTDVVRILYDSVRDRFAGYPNESDEFVPFFDMDSQTNKYPVVGVAGKPLPLDWQIDANVNDENHKEHVQDRWSWYDKEPILSTANAFYIMQGMCDPSVTDPTAFTYWENCTEANNDVSTGGTVNPSPTNYQVYQKASSLSPILKAVFESNQDFRVVGIYFSNGGAGSVLNFPHFQLRTSGSYSSIGCEWMNEPNPYDPSRPIGTKDEIAKCRSEGTKVSSRSYNVLERGWCRDQALNPFQPLVDGPYIDAFNGALVMSAGQGIYDRVTNEFIGCSYVEWYMDNLEHLLNDSKFTENSQVTVARLDDGTTVASTMWDSTVATDTVKVYELDIGLTFESFEQLKTLVDYTTTWDPTEVREKYESFSFRHDGFLLSMYPVPAVPQVYDPNYVPLFFTILSASEEDIFQVVEDVKEKVDEHVTQVMYMSLVIGATGFAIVLLFIYLMSRALTAPLEYMNAAADEIINHFGSTSCSTNETEIINSTPGYWFTPRTELDEVVKEFNEMVTSFEFASAAKCVNDERVELRNEFTMQEDFHDLYRSRKEVNFGYKVGRIGSGIGDITQFINLGSNVAANEDNLSKAEESVVEGGFTSRLFFWTVLLIGTPLLLTTIAISAIFIQNMSKEFRSGIEEAESFYLEVETNALSIYATLLAHVVSSGTSRPTRDLHILTRYASWLLFGGVERAVSFTEVKTGVEKCKTFSDTKECPFYEQNYVCDGGSNERAFTNNYHTSDNRLRQDLFFTCEASDRSSNGARNFTNFPNVSYSPESTVWWDDARTLPGSNKWVLSAGYETSYDRVRVISASPVHQLVHNQDVEKTYTYQNAIAFEADGMFISFFGCSNVFATASKWSSTEANGAYKIRPELCPLGKYGYDPRCREWYDTGKKLAEKDGTPIHFTPLYAYADSRSTIGQSATSPLIDPLTKEHIGQVLIDFKPGPILESLSDKNVPLAAGGSSILITTLPGPDIVVGPGFSFLNESARPISELVLRDDYNCIEIECTLRRGHFDEIVSSMKQGDTRNTNFTRRSSTGSVETVHIAYAPVVLKAYRPLDSADFSRGVESSEVLIYSLALAQTEKGILEPFKKIEEEINQTIRVSIVVLSVTVSLSILFAIYIISVVILSVIKPMFVLLDIIRSINRNMNEEPPIIDRSNSSKEMNSFSETIQTLYKVARCGNYAFVSGDLERAYTAMNDSFQLFHRLDNPKAVGVVSNNLGNLLLIVFRSMEEGDKEHFCGMTKADVINKGISFYYEAIQLGEDAYGDFQGNEGFSPDCLEFMQHLSNRYFNRGMFLLTVKDGHEQTDELEKLGYQDLDIATDLDNEVVDIGLKAGWEHTTSVVDKFDMAIGRARGHLTLQEMGFPDTWDVEDRLDNAFVMLRKEIHSDTNSSLFETINASGRLQEIETELIRYKLLKGEVRLAAQIGIRMLVEDEFIFPEAQEKALEALSKFSNQSMEDEKNKRSNSRTPLLKGVMTDMSDGEDKHQISIPSDDAESP